MTTPAGNIAFGNELAPENQLKEMDLAKQIADKLDTHFPGYLWAVNVDLFGGMATIQPLRLTGEWGCYLKLASLMNDPTLAAVVRSGGEILERYRVHRGAADADEIGSLNRNFAGRIEVDTL